MTIAFLIPVEPKLVTGMVILLTILSLFLAKEWSTLSFWRSPRLVKLTLLAIQAFFLYHIFGLLWTADMDAGLLDISRKLNLFFLPILVFLLPIGEKTILRVFKAFIMGVFLSVILNQIHSLIQYMDVRQFHVFTGSSAIRNVHLGYYAVYLLFSMTLVVDFLLSPKQGKGEWNKKTYIFLGICSIPILILSGSKMGFITLTVLILSMTLFILKGRDWKRVVLIPLIAVGVMTLAVTQTQHLRDRLTTMYRVTFHSPIEPESVESTMARRMTWKAATEVWSLQPILGCGTGDLDIAMNEAYLRNGFTGPLEHGLNPHSQYLQAGAALGLIGFSLLLLSMMSGLIQGLKKGQFALIAFFLIMLLAHMTESFLERQEGVQFWAFFAPLMLLWSMEREKNEKYKEELLTLLPF